MLSCLAITPHLPQKTLHSLKYILVSNKLDQSGSSFLVEIISKKKKMEKQKLIIYLPHMWVWMWFVSNKAFVPYKPDHLHLYLLPPSPGVVSYVPSSTSTLFHIFQSKSDKKWKTYLFNLVLLIKNLLNTSILKHTSVPSHFWTDGKYYVSGFTKRWITSFWSQDATPKSFRFTPYQNLHHHPQASKANFESPLLLLQTSHSSSSFC